MGGGGGGGGGGEGRARTSQRLCCDPTPPSSHSPSLAYMHVSSQIDGTLGGDGGGAVGAGVAGGASKPHTSHRLWELPPGVPPGAQQRQPQL